MNDMRKLMETVEPLYDERFASSVGSYDFDDDVDAGSANTGFFEKMRFRALYRKYKTKFIYASVRHLEQAAQKARDLAEYYGYLAGENDISERNLRRIQRQYEFDRKGIVIEAAGETVEQFHRYTDWRKHAERQGYTCEHGGDGKIIAHENGEEKGVWDPRYGGSGHGWFHN